MNFHTVVKKHDAAFLARRKQIEMDKHRLRTKGLEEHYASPNLGVVDFLECYRIGYYLSEGDVCLHVCRAEEREIIPLVENFPHGAIQDLEKRSFTISINQRFAEVLENCALPREGDGPRDIWLGDRMKYYLGELHRRGHAHSVESHFDGELVGGVLGLKTGSVFISLSVFSRVSGGGNAAFIGLHKILCRNGYDMHDAIMPNNISRFFGGHLIPRATDLAIRREAVNKSLVFPEIPASFEAACVPQSYHPQRTEAYGRPLPR